MAHQHTHKPEAGAGGRSILIAVVLNVGIVAAQVIGGLLSGSLALLADAVHNASDAAALGISYVARRVSARPPDARRTFGYRRVETVAAVINLTTLIVIGLYLLVQAVVRLIEPGEVHGTTMLIVGAIAFVEDMISVAVLYRSAKGSLNIRSAMLHLVADTLTTVAVMIGAAAVMLFDLPIVDPLLTILISVFILVHGVRELREAASVLIESAPAGFDYEGAVEAMRGVSGVESVHHVHVWQLDEGHTALEAHLVVGRGDLGEMERVKRDVRHVLHDGFEVEHATLEIELPGSAGHDDAVLPHHG